MQVRDMIYEYKDAFSLRDEIGTYPNTEIDIGVLDRMPFFIRPYQIREDKRMLDKEMKRLCYLGILKGFSAYSSPICKITTNFLSKFQVICMFCLKEQFYAIAV